MGSYKITAQQVLYLQFTPNLGCSLFVRLQQKQRQFFHEDNLFAIIIAILDYCPTLQQIQGVATAIATEA